MQTQAAQQARDTIGEMARLIATASEAPRAAAEVVGALREKLSDSMVRDNDMLEERSRIMATLGSLLDAVNQAATEQRSAIDALVGIVGRRCCSRPARGSSDEDRSRVRTGDGGGRAGRRQRHRHGQHGRGIWRRRCSCSATRARR